MFFIKICFGLGLGDCVLIMTGSRALNRLGEGYLCSKPRQVVQEFVSQVTVVKRIEILRKTMVSSSLEIGLGAN